MPDTEQRIERIEAALERLTATVAAHDDQIAKILTIAEAQQDQWEQLQREWQAYLTTIHPRQ